MQIHSRAATYFASNPKPTATPASIQSRVESRSMARHVIAIARVQKKTESASMVINVEPTASKGAAQAAAIVKKPARGLAYRDKNVSKTPPPSAARVGEKKRTPKAVSPQIVVPRNWMYAINGGLL